MLEPKGLVFDGVLEHLHEAEELLVGHRGLLELQPNHLLVFVVPSADVFVSAGLLNQTQNVGLLFAQHKQLQLNLKKGRTVLEEQLNSTSTHLNAFTVDFVKKLVPLILLLRQIFSNTT